MRHQKARVAILLVSVALWAHPALAQAPAAGAAGDGQASEGVGFLTAYRFHLSATSLQSDDPRFHWDCYFGGDIDLLDYGRGRVNLLADYDVVLGSEFRSIDPNQGNYHLDVSASARTGPAEWFGVFHHVSRHLSDRANRASISWNTLGLQAVGTHAVGPTTFIVNARAAKVLQAAFVDYAWEAGSGGEVRRRLSDRFDLLARADLDLMGVSSDIANRDTQVGARVEAAVRVYGTGAGVEAFAGWERRIDPYPNERQTVSWVILGFRFISRQSR